MTQRFLVTGGAGFIGAALVARLVQHGHQVTVIDDASRGQPARLSNIMQAIDFRPIDVRDSRAVSAAARGADAIIHLAAVNGTEFFYSKPQLVLDVGVRGILAVLDACRENKIKQLFVASSSEVYQTPPRVPTSEAVPLSIPDPLNPRYSYGGSKIATELLAINYGRNEMDRVVIFRPHNVYGSDMGREHVIPQLAMRAAKAVAVAPPGPVPLPVQGDGRQTRAFVHIDDFIEGAMLVINKGEHLGIYNIGTDTEVSIGDLAKQIARCFGREAQIIPQAAASGATPRRCPDISRLRRLGFAPRVSLAQGLPPVVAWYAQNTDEPQEIKV